jgi:iron complex transport system ATP-binding protein
MKLRVEGITVKLGSRDVLKDVTFEVRRGDFVALLGPNGSGKSTMLRTIFGILKPLSGVILLDGKSISGIDEASKNMGYLPQEVPDVNLRVIDVVLLGRTPYLSGIKKAGVEDTKIAEKALKEVGLEGFGDRKFSELSGGEKQKVMLARVFAQNPKIMLLDEPTAHLDISAQLEILGIVKRRVEAGCSAIIAIHDINLASSFADFILMVKDGRIAYAGEPREIITVNTIKDVFGADVIVKRHGNSVYVIPKKKSRVNNVRVHVICGGGSGKNIIYILSEAGYSISAGVLNALDSDWEAITEVGGEVVDEAPFMEIGDEAYGKNLKMVEGADVVVLSNLSFGKGNLRNLMAAKHAANLGKLIVVDATPFSSRNFAGDEADRVYSEILKKARVVKKEGDLIDAIRQLLHTG